MSKTSAGILLYRRSKKGHIEVFLVHPGGPFYRNKWYGVWSIPKGLVEEGEDPQTAAFREFQEETGFSLDRGQSIFLGETRLKSGKKVLCWAVEGDVDPDDLQSNTFTIEWPPRSGKEQCFPEVDRGAWYSLKEAFRRIHPSQIVFLERLREKLVHD